MVLAGKKLLATHIPLLTQGDPDTFILYGHIARNNAMFPFLENGKEVLLIFAGPHGYISSSWYRKKDISTWDYIAVHINATLRLQTETELEASLAELVARFEEEQEQPVYFNDIPREIIDAHLPGIRGFWCDPIQIEAVAKLHQGFASADVTSILGHLEKQDKPWTRELLTMIKNENDH